jgi:hypothetical protein
MAEKLLFMMPGRGIDLLIHLMVPPLPRAILNNRDAAARGRRCQRRRGRGLVAAALGIERGEEARLAALRDSLGFAVRVDQAGQPAFDYHTTQTPPTKRNRRFATRADELAVPKHELKTILSTSEYRTGARLDDGHLGVVRHQHSRGTPPMASRSRAWAAIQSGRLCVQGSFGIGKA